jgi:hypothetical protein
MKRSAAVCLRTIVALVLVLLPCASKAQPCTPSDTTLCLNSNRFAVSATWRKTDGTSGEGHAISVTGDTGYFWFFDPTNIEVVTKLLDACGVNNHYWVFGSGLTNLDVTLTYTDGATGAQQTYHNPQGVAFEPVQDTGAFSTCSTATAQVADVSGAWAAVLNLNGFSYETSLSLFQTGSSVTGVASIFGAGGGSITGTVTGQTLQFTINEVSPCSGSFSGSASVDATNLYTSGSISGSDCNGSYSGSWDATKTFIGSPASQGAAIVGGLWNTTLALSQGQLSGVVAFVQAGSSLTGTAVLTGHGSGSLTGSVVGNNLRFIVDELSPCFGIFLGAATISGNSIGSGTIIGTDCDGTYQGTLSGTKQ